MDFLDTWRYGRIRQESNHLENLSFYVNIVRQYGIVIIEDEFKGGPNCAERPQKMSGEEAAAYIYGLRVHEKPDNGFTYKLRAHESAIILEIKGHDSFGHFKRRITIYRTDEA